MAKSKQIEALRLIVQGKVLPTLIEEAPGEWFARWREVEPEGEENPWIDKVMREVASIIEGAKLQFFSERAK